MHLCGNKTGPPVDAQKETDSAVDLVLSLLSAKQQPPHDLIEVASRSRRWASSGLAKRCAQGYARGGAGDAGCAARSQGAGDDSGRGGSGYGGSHSGGGGGGRGGGRSTGGIVALDQFAPPQLHAQQRVMESLRGLQPAPPPAGLSHPPLYQHQQPQPPQSNEQPAGGSAAAVAAAIAARLSAQVASNSATSGHGVHGGDGVDSSTPASHLTLQARQQQPPPPLTPSPPPPPPPPLSQQQPLSSTQAARAAAQAIANRLSAGIAARVGPQS
eukprot:6172338-Pleurochrysis_carterae.AAC.2